MHQAISCALCLALPLLEPPRVRPGTTLLDLLRRLISLGAGLPRVVRTLISGLSLAATLIGCGSGSASSDSGGIEARVRIIEISDPAALLDEASGPNDLRARLREAVRGDDRSFVVVARPTPAPPEIFVVEHGRDDGAIKRIAEIIESARGTGGFSSTTDSVLAVQRRLLRTNAGQTRFDVTHLGVSLVSAPAEAPSAADSLKRDSSVFVRPSDELLRRPSGASVASVGGSLLAAVLGLLLLLLLLAEMISRIALRVSFVGLLRLRSRSSPPVLTESLAQPEAGRDAAISDSIRAHQRHSSEDAGSPPLPHPTYGYGDGDARPVTPRVIPRPGPESSGVDQRTRPLMDHRSGHVPEPSRIRNAGMPTGPGTNAATGAASYRVLQEIEIGESEVGWTFDRVFGQHVLGISHAKVSEPYLLLPYQARNAHDLIKVLARRGVRSVHLVTRIPEPRDRQKHDELLQDIVRRAAVEGVRVTVETREKVGRFVRLGARQVSTGGGLHFHQQVIAGEEGRADWPTRASFIRVTESLPRAEQS